MSIVLFENDDLAYLRWLADNSDGYVVNMRKRQDDSYLVLHRASCFSITRYPDMDNDPGGFTERAYRKLCAASIADLKEYLSKVTNKRDPFSKRCSLCHVERL
jgi:hypothetical protein